MFHDSIISGRGIEVFTIIVIAMLAYSTALAPAAPATQPDSPKPDPALQPADVVKIVVDSLGGNDENDNGIRTTWTFASPANQAVTGPVERFIPMVKSPAFAPMLKHKSVAYSTPEVKDDQAMQAVVITGADGVKTVYIFQLSRQTEGKLKGCWMTDGVIPVKPQADSSGIPV